jgi:hypothetical protein
MQGTALQVIQQAAAELGLPVPSSGISSQEQTSIQLVALLNSAGYEMTYGHDWQLLRKKATITTEANKDEYDLPSDFGRIVNQTIWSSDQMLSLYGPLSPQDWEANLEGGVANGPHTAFCFKGNKILFTPSPASSGDTITFDYISNGWLQSYLDPSIYTNHITNDLDTVLFDFFLMVKFLKVKMWNAKGLDSTALETDLNRLFQAIIGGEKGARIQSLTPRRGFHSVANNIPITGYGQ